MKYTLKQQNKTINILEPQNGKLIEVEENKAYPYRDDSNSIDFTFVYLIENRKFGMIVDFKREGLESEFAECIINKKIESIFKEAGVLR